MGIFFVMKYYFTEPITEPDLKAISSVAKEVIRNTNENQYLKRFTETEKFCEGNNSNKVQRKDDAV